MPVERMTVVFPEPMAEEIRAAVERGEYASTSEVVREAMRLWSDRREAKTLERKALRRAWDEGKKSGSAGHYDMRAIIAEAKSDKKRRA